MQPSATDACGKCTNVNEPLVCREGKYFFPPKTACPVVIPIVAIARMGYHPTASKSGGWDTNQLPQMGKGNRPIHQTTDETKHSYLLRKGNYQCMVGLYTNKQENLLLMFMQLCNWVHTADTLEVSCTVIPSLIKLVRIIHRHLIK